MKILETWESVPIAPCHPTTWHVLSKEWDIDLEIWTCVIRSPDKPEGETADCYACFIRDMAIQTEGEQMNELPEP